MNRRVMFFWGPLATLAVFIGALGLLRLYLAEATELLVAELTGAGARVERIDLGYLPPSLTLHGVMLDTGAERIEVPRIDLYPDLGDLLHGRVALDRAVLDRPHIRAGLSGGSGGGVDPALLPRSLSIRDASVVVGRDGRESSPVAFSVDLEKEAVGVGVVVKNAAVPEFGLTFSGTVDMPSASPLKVGVTARKGTFNPSRLFDFLHRFGYLDETTAALFADSEQIGAEDFRLDFDARTGAASFAAESFVLDGSTLAGLAAEVGPEGGWRLACREGLLDAARMVALLRAHPDGGKALERALRGLGLASLAADGGVSLRDVEVGSAGGAAEPAGTLSLAASALRLSLVSENGGKQDVTFENLDALVTLKNGRPTVAVRRLDLASSAGGTGSLTGELAVPFALAGTRFQVEARRLDWFGTILDGTLAKKDARQVAFDVTLRGGETLLAAKGLARNEFGGPNRWAVVFDDLTLRTAEPAPGGEAEPFDFGFVGEGGPSGGIVVRRLQYNDLPVVRDLSAQVASSPGRMVVKGRGRLCLMRVGLEMALTPGSLAADVAVTGNGAQLPGVLGCFVDELPVYLRGRLTVRANFFLQGGNGRELRRSLRGDVTARLRGLDVLKLSNLDRRLGFFLELMNAAGLEPDKGDTLSFRDATVFASVRGDAVTLGTVRFAGDALSVDGRGNFNLADKRLRLDARVATPFGVNRDMSIDMVLSEEKS